jgi:hypothetical protein
VTIQALYDAARLLLYALLSVTGYCDLAAARHRVLAAIHPGRLCAELSDAHVPTARPAKKAIQSVLAIFMFLSLLSASGPNDRSLPLHHAVASRDRAPGDQQVRSLTKPLGALRTVRRSKRCVRLQATQRRRHTPWHHGARIPQRSATGHGKLRRVEQREFKARSGVARSRVGASAVRQFLFGRRREFSTIGRGQNLSIARAER